MKYFKKIEVQAIQYNGNNISQVIEFSSGKFNKQPIYSSLINDQGEVLQIGDYLVLENDILVMVKSIQFERNYIVMN